MDKGVLVVNIKAEISLNYDNQPAHEASDLDYIFRQELVGNGKLSINKDI